jgi:uncharacterized protein
MADQDPGISMQARSDAPFAANDMAPLAVITGASSGIGLELARIAASEGYALVLAALDFPADFRARLGDGDAADVRTVATDLSTSFGIDQLVAEVADRPVALLCANAGEGLGKGFLEQDFARVRHMIETNVIGTTELVQQVARRMRDAGTGRILFTGSIAGEGPAPYQAAYGATKAYVNSLAEALREELRDTGISVTVLMPGATDTAIFDKAGVQDTLIGAGPKADPADVAKAGWKAVMSGDDKIVPGAANKAQVLMARILPSTLAARGAGKLSEPGGARAAADLLPMLLIGGGIAAGAIALVASLAGARTPTRRQRLLRRGAHLADALQGYRPKLRF